MSDLLASIDGQRTVAQLAKRLGLDTDALSRLLRVLELLGLVEPASPPLPAAGRRRSPTPASCRVVRQSAPARAPRPEPGPTLSRPVPSTTVACLRELSARAAQSQLSGPVVEWLERAKTAEDSGDLHGAVNAMKVATEIAPAVVSVAREYARVRARYDSERVPGAQTRAVPDGRVGEPLRRGDDLKE